MGRFQAATFDRYKEMLDTRVANDLAEMFTSREAFSEIANEAGPRPWEELGTWAQLARWYVGSQLQVLERNFTTRPQEPGLARVVAYVGTHAADVIELTRGWTGSTTKIRADLNRATPENFSREESERDLAILREFKAILRPHRNATGVHWVQVFERQCRELCDEDSPTFGLPEFHDLDLAIDTFLDMTVKYAELVFGHPQHPFSIGATFTDVSPIEPLSKEWKPKLNEVATSEST